MSDEITPTPPTSAPVPSDLQHARMGLIGGLAALVRVARALPEASAERDTVQLAIGETTTALTRIFPHALATSAQEHAMRTLEIRPPGEEHTPMSGETLEMYAAELCKYLFAHAEDA
jgi:hypothetical protein